MRSSVRTARDAELVDVALALATYKDPEYPVRRGLEEALALVTPHVATSEDPETLGVAGAIEKRLYDLDVRREHLERACKLYERGHELDRDHGWPRYGYPGINAAYLLEVLAGVRLDERERLLARVRELWTELISIPAPPDTSEPSVRYFHHVTIADALLGLDRHEQALAAFARARATQVAGWQLETSARQTAAQLRLRSRDGRIDERGRAALAALLGSDAEAVASAVRGKVGIGLSGGGFRASLFHIGVLAWLAEIDLLRHVEVLSCVSGGSLLGALYHLELQHLYAGKRDSEIGRDDFVALVDRLIERFPEAIRANLRTRVLFEPDQNAAMLRGERSRTEVIGELYEAHLYAKIGDLDPKTKPKRSMEQLVIEPLGEKDFEPARGNWRRRARVPEVILNAACLNTGHAWHFSARGMGEPPVRAEDAVDVNDRFERREYQKFPNAWQHMRLGYAAAASACVPALFEPLELRGAYGNYVVRLVDGGLYDNQGAAALLERDATSLVISDASGQMSLETDPEGHALGVGLRSNGVLQARLREAQYLDLRSRIRGKLLRNLAFLHLKRGIEPRIIAPGSTSVGVAHTAELPYGISTAVQERLAALRTDLDAFSELEAEALMASGYLMAREAVDPAAFELPRDVGRTLAPKQPSFLRVAPLLVASPGGSATEKRVLELLEIGSAVFGKAFRVSDRLRDVAVATGAAIACVLAIGIWRYWESTLAHVTVGGAAVALVTALLRWRLPQAGTLLDALSPQQSVLGALKSYTVGAAAAFVARLSVTFADPTFLEAGRVEPLLSARRLELERRLSSPSKTPGLRPRKAVEAGQAMPVGDQNE